MRTTPKLRFKEFTEEWHVKKIGDIAPLQRGFDLPNSHQRPGAYPIVFSNGPLKSHEKYMVRSPGVVTGRSGTIGKVHYIEQDYWPHNTALWVTDFKDNSPKYIYYIYKNLHLERFGGGSSVPTLNRNDVHAQMLAIPSKPEQEKVAGFLTVVDERVELAEKRVALLKKYKKGMMQKIFTQKIRFKDEDGNDYPEWEERKLGEITFVIAGQSPLGHTYNTKGNGLPLYQGKKDFGPTYTTTSGVWTTQPAKRADKFDVLLSVRAPVGALNYAGEDMAIGRGLAAIKPKEGVVREYVFSHLDSLDSIFKSLSGGSTFESISTKDIKDLPIKLPCTDEQQKIADFLTSLDDKIKIEEEKLTQAKNFKKSLLQRMFV